MVNQSSILGCFRFFLMVYFHRRLFTLKYMMVPSWVWQDQLPSNNKWSRSSCSHATNFCHLCTRRKRSCPELREMWLLLESLGWTPPGDSGRDVRCVCCWCFFESQKWTRFPISLFYLLEENIHEASEAQPRCRCRKATTDLYFSFFPTIPLIDISVVFLPKQRSEILKGYSSFTELQCSVYFADGLIKQ